MAIQVGGTTVINNSKELVGITGADTTTKNALVAAGVGGDPTFLVSPPNFSSPNNTYSNSGTWSKGSLSDNQLIWVYLVAGGGGSTGPNAATGGSYRFVVATAGTLDGSSFTIGTGTNTSTGNPSSITIDGTTYSTSDGNKFTVVDGAMPTGVDTQYFDVQVYTPTITNSVSNGRVFSGGNSQYVYYDGSAGNSGYGETSVYAGDGGDSRVFHSSYSGQSNYNTSPQNGDVPGGAGGAAYYSGYNTVGGKGNMRTYHL